MRNSVKYIIGSLLMGMFALTACNDAAYDELTNQAYILQTNTDANSSQKITIGNDPVAATINVRLSDKAAVTSNYRLVYDESALEKYNKKNETSYTLLPENCFTLSSTEATITEGTSVSAPISITISPLNEEMKNSGKKYALAFRLENTDGKANVLQSGSVMVYLLDQVVIQPVVVFNSSNNFGEIQLDQTVDLPEWTVELNINKDQLKTAVGQGNNQAFFGAYSESSEIYMRFGDAPIEGNRINIKTQGSQMNSQMLFNTNTWYHLALVCTGTKLYFYVNGVLDNSMDLPGTGNSMSCFSTYIHNGYHLGNTMMSELRLWRKARTQNEIVNNMYLCDPTSDGLVFYFKFNEGSGNTFIDATGHGYDISTPDVNYTWIQDVRIDGK
ncbi:MAG: BT_3987 domain-containing protein [Muribaculaceae bacterium]